MGGYAKNTNIGIILKYDVIDWINDTKLVCYNKQLLTYFWKKILKTLSYVKTRKVSFTVEILK